MRQNENKVSSIFKESIFNYPSKLLYQGTFHGLADSMCMPASQMFSAQLQLDWTKHYIVNLLRSVIEPSHPVHTGGFQQESPNVLFWSWDFVHVDIS